jgi:hypothetical protein
VHERVSENAKQFESGTKDDFRMNQDVWDLGCTVPLNDLPTSAPQTTPIEFACTAQVTS